MSNLVNNYKDQEKYNDAEELYRECLEERKRVLEPDDPYILER